jgi:hypothetical protein
VWTLLSQAEGNVETRGTTRGLLLLTPILPLQLPHQFFTG